MLCFVDDLGGKRNDYALATVDLNDSIPERYEIVTGAVIPITRFEDDKMTQIMLYIRAHLVDQFERVYSFLDDTNSNTLYATGAPGCGKTCFFWMMAGMLMKQGKTVLFIQYRTALGCQIWVLKGNRGDFRAQRVISPDLVTKTLDVDVNDFVSTQPRKFDVCICDGLLMHQQHSIDLVERLGRLKGQTKSAKISKLILVTSLQFSLNMKGGEAQVSHTDPTVFVSFDSWLEDDYQLAIKSDLVKDSFVKDVLLHDWLTLTGGNAGIPAVAQGEILSNDTQQVESIEPTDDQDIVQLSEEQKIEQAVVLKYYLAGGCARYMFQWDVDTLLTKLKLFFENVPPNEWSSFIKTNMAASTNTAVNSLMQRFSAGPGSFTCFAVSKYVLLRAHMECREELTKAMKGLGDATSNPVLKGWAFELGQLDEIQLALDANRTGTCTAVGNNKLNLVPKAEIAFDGMNMIDGVNGLPAGEMVNNTFIRCLKYNQGCFDAAFYFDETISVDSFKFFPPTGTARVTRRTKASCGTPVVVSKAGKIAKRDVAEAFGSTSRIEKDGEAHYIKKI